MTACVMNDEDDCSTDVPCVECPLFPKAKALSYTCPVRGCTKVRAREVGFVDPADAVAHIAAFHPRQLDRPPDVRRWPHGVEMYEAALLDVGPMRSAP